MLFKKSLGKILVYVMLQIGAFSGAPIRPEEIEQLMKMSEPCVTQTMRKDKDKDDDPE